MAVGARRSDHQQRLQRAPGRRHARVILRIAQQQQRLQRIDHRREDGAETVLPVQALEYPSFGPTRGAAAHGLRNQPIDVPHAVIQQPKRLRQPARATGGQMEVVPLLFGGRREQLANVNVARIPGDWLVGRQDEERHHHRARPVRHPVDVKREPARHQHDLDRDVRHPAPRNLTEQSERDPREYVGPRRSAALQNGGACPGHVWRVGAVADQFQGEVRLDGAADVQIAAVIQRPAAMIRLSCTQIGGELCLEGRIGLPEVMQHHDVLSGDRAVRFELEGPVAGLVLHARERGACRTHRAIQQSASSELFDIATRGPHGRLGDARVADRGTTIQSPDLPSDRRADRS